MSENQSKNNSNLGGLLGVILFFGIIFSIIYLLKSESPLISKKISPNSTIGISSVKVGEELDLDNVIDSVHNSGLNFYSSDFKFMKSNEKENIRSVFLSKEDASEKMRTTYFGLSRSLNFIADDDNDSWKINYLLIYSTVKTNVINKIKINVSFRDQSDLCKQYYQSIIDFIDNQYTEGGGYYFDVQNLYANEDYKIKVSSECESNSSYYNEISIEIEKLGMDNQIESEWDEKIDTDSKPILNLIDNKG